MYYLYPFFLCLIPIHTIFAENIAEVGLKNYILSCFFMWLFILIGISSLNFIAQNLIVAELCFVIVFFLILNANNLYKDRIRTWELEARLKMRLKRS